MITLDRIKNLERTFELSTKGKNRLIVRSITSDGRLLDDEDFIMTQEEVNIADREDKKARKRGSIVVYQVSYCEPKLKQSSMTQAYL